MPESQVTSLDGGVLEPLLDDGKGAGTGQYPLSCAQQSLWFTEQMARGTPAYNLPEAWRLQGVLDLAALQQSLDELVRRHEILRSNIVAQQGKPRQRILRCARIELEVVDVAGAADPESE